MSLGFLLTLPGYYLEAFFTTFIIRRTQSSCELER